MKKTILCYFLFLVSNLLSAQEHSYSFNGTLNELSGAGPALNELISCSATDAGDFASQLITIRNGGAAGTDATCGSTPKSVFAFNEGGGLAYPNNNFITDTYTIHLFFKFTALTYSYQRVIDFKGSTADDGIYIRSNGCLNFYTSSGASSVGACPYFVADRFYLISLVRNGATKEMKVYVNGVPFVTSYIDNSNFYAPTTGTTPIIFFRDNDGSWGCEDQSGSIKYLSVKPTLSTDAQVAATWAGICSIVLPLKLTSFTAAKEGRTAVLNWKTTEEINTSHFEIERSVDGRTYTSIGNVSTANTPGEHTYQFVDKQTLSGSNQYRLKMVDRDGTFRYSTVVRVLMEAQGAVDLFPNPAKNQITLRGLEQATMVHLLNAEGKILLTQKVVGQTVSFDLNCYVNGIYLVQYFDGKQLQQQKFIKQH